MITIHISLVVYAYTFKTVRNLSCLPIAASNMLPVVGSPDRGYYISTMAVKATNYIVERVPETHTKTTVCILLTAAFGLTSSRPHDVSYHSVVQCA